MKLQSPAAGRNKQAILDVLRRVAPRSGTVLEVASGSGEHVVHFAAALPHLRFVPSDPDERARASVEAWRIELDLPNVEPPLRLDAAAPECSVESADVVVCINMVHISPWAATLGLLDKAAAVLPVAGTLLLYGPYFVQGRSTPSNRAFDADLRSRNPAWGVRELDDVEREAQRRGLVARERVEMPANNLCVVFDKAAKDAVE